MLKRRYEILKRRDLERIERGRRLIAIRELFFRHEVGQ